MYSSVLSDVHKRQDKIYAEQLANEYALKDTSKVIALRKLDATATLPATVFTYTFGIITALVAGVGMCLSMKAVSYTHLILMGSTQKMGAGTNVQNKLAASSDLDCPLRPSDLEQRLGRSIQMCIRDSTSAAPSISAQTSMKSCPLMMSV